MERHSVDLPIGGMIPIDAAQSMSSFSTDTAGGKKPATEPARRAAPVRPALAAALAAAAPRYAVELTGLTKLYRAGKGQAAKPALEGVDLAIPRGAVFGLLGPNGAGKSTLINILAGLVLKTAGRAVIWGVDIDRDARQARAAIGGVPQELNIAPFFTPREPLEL